MKKSEPSVESPTASSARDPNLGAVGPIGAELLDGLDISALCCSMAELKTTVRTSPLASLVTLSAAATFNTPECVVAAGMRSRILTAEHDGMTLFLRPGKRIDLVMMLQSSSSLQISESQRSSMIPDRVGHITRNNGLCPSDGDSAHRCSMEF